MSERTVSHQQWIKIAKELRAPFHPHQILFRPLRKTGNKWEVAAYVSKVAVARRLDKVVGPGYWTYDFSPIVVSSVPTKVTSYDEVERKKIQSTVDVMEMTRAKGTITIFGVSRSALGDASNTNPSKGCESDAFKRAAVMFGIGAYLYDLPKLFINDADVSFGKISDNALQYLYSQLPVPAPPQPKQPQLKEGEASNEDIEEGMSRAAAEEEIPEDEGPIGEPPPEEESHEPELPAAKNQKPQIDKERYESLQSFAIACQEKGLSTENKALPNQKYAVAQLLQIPGGKAGLDNLSTEQVLECAMAIRDGKLKW